jgi:hypothetical protein
MGGGSLEVAEAIDDYVGDRWARIIFASAALLSSAGASRTLRRRQTILR